MSAAIRPDLVASAPLFVAAFVRFHASDAALLRFLEPLPKPVARQLRDQLAHMRRTGEVTSYVRSISLRGFNGPAVFVQRADGSAGVGAVHSDFPPGGLAELHERWDGLKLPEFWEMVTIPMGVVREVLQ